MSTTESRRSKRLAGHPQLNFNESYLSSQSTKSGNDPAEDEESRTPNSRKHKTKRAREGLGKNERISKNGPVDAEDSEDFEEDDFGPQARGSGAKRKKRVNAPSGRAKSRKPLQKDPFGSFTGKSEALRNIRLSKIKTEDVDHLVKMSDDDPNFCLRTLLELVLEACGCSSSSIQNTQFFELGNVDEVVNEQVSNFEASYDEALTIFPSKKNVIKKHDRVRDCYLEFWSTLIVQGRERLMFSDDPTSLGSQLSLRISDVFEALGNYLMSLSSKPPRALRIGANLAVLSLVHGCAIVANDLQSTCNARRKQKKPGKSSKAARLDEDMKRFQDKISLIENYIRTLFTGVFAHRYRDVDARIRADCITLLGMWIQAYPTFFLKDTFLKYLGWLLNDPDAIVRLASVKSLNGVYGSLGKNYLQQFEIFTQRFQDRLVEMVDDQNIDVAVEAFELIDTLVSEEFISADVGQEMTCHLFDSCRPIRKAAANFVNTYHQRTRESPLQLEDIIEAGSKHADKNNSLLANAVDAAWDNCEDLRSLTKAVKLIKKAEKESDFADQHTRIAILCLITQKLSGIDIVSTSHVKFMEDQGLVPKDESHTLGQFARFLPDLVRIYRNDEFIFESLIGTLASLNFEDSSVNSQKRAFHSVLNYMKDAFLKQANEDVLAKCVKAFIVLKKSKALGIQFEVDKALESCTKNVVKRLKEIARIMLDENADPDDSEGLSYEMVDNLTRLVCLVAYVPVRDEEVYELFSSLMTDVVSGELEVDGQVLNKVIRALFFRLLWETKEKDKDDESVMDSRDSLISSLTFSLSNEDETVVKEAFCLLVDILIAFKSNLDPTTQLLAKLREVKKDDVMNEQIKAMKRHFKELWNEKLEVEEQSEQEEEDE